MAHLLSQACSRTLLLLSLLLLSTAAHAGTTTVVTAPNISVTLSPGGEIVAVKYGPSKKERALHALLHLTGCRIAGPVSAESTTTKGLIVTKRWISGKDSSECVVIERFEPSLSSIRWEAEIRGTGKPWSTPIETQLSFPLAKGAKIWAPWGDPRRGRIGRMTPAQQARLGILQGDSAWSWSDPLVPIPFVSDTLWFGAEMYRDEDPKIGFIPWQGNLISIPMVSVMEPDFDQALTIALSPEDDILDLRVVVNEEGGLCFSRFFHRISDKSSIRIALDLVPHEADWRGALRWMVERYPGYFNPSIPGADDVAGTGAYSAHEAEFDVAKMKKMAFGVNWKASFDFPYMGMFLPPVENDTVQWIRYGGGPTSVKAMRDYSASMRAKGFHVLSYFNVTEFGANVIDPPPPRKSTRDEDLWRDANDFLYTKLSGAIIPIPPRGADMLHSQNPKLRADGPYYTWGEGIATDPGDPVYQEFLLDQAKRHIDEIPDASGICIDRMDWLRLYNYKADDGISWFDDAPARSLLWSWRSIMSKLGPMMHNAGKVIFVNNHDKRIDMLNQTDGFFDEFTYAGSPLNLSAFQGIRKPTLGWTGEEKHLRPDPDVFFQKYLHMGVYPTAPFPGNDHSLLPNAWVDSQYLDYGPLLQPLRGKKWVLTPHCVEVIGARAKANLFEVAGGWALPVTFGPKKGSVTVRLRGVPGLADDLAVDAIHPGSETATTISAKMRKGAVELTVPLVRGCAMVRIRNTGNSRQESGTKIIPLSEPKKYADHRPAARYELGVKDQGIVLRHGTGPAGCDSLGARDVWVWEDAGTYFMHYDGAGTTGWLACRATSRNLADWTVHGPVLQLGDRNHQDCASASYGVTFSDGKQWHMFYLGTPNTSPAPDLVPSFPYLTMKAEGNAPTGPWKKRYDITPFRPSPGTYYAATASPGHVIRRKKDYIMFFSASTDDPIFRTIAVARTRNLDGPWMIDPKPIIPPTEQVENASLYFQEGSKTWFLFTNHVGLRDGLEYTDAIWVYWTQDLERWDPSRKAVVLDGSRSSWSKEIIGLPSVVRYGNKLALLYDGYAGQGIPPGASSHMKRDVGLAWIDLPIATP